MSQDESLLQGAPEESGQQKVGGVSRTRSVVCWLLAHGMQGVGQQVNQLISDPDLRAVLSLLSRSSLYLSPTSSLLHLHLARATVVF